MEATVRLFKSVIIDKHTDNTVRLDTVLAHKTLRKGFIITPEVATAVSDHTQLIKTVEAAYGLSPEKLNAAFHKSFAKVRNADIEDLVFEQILHYLTTYGAEAAGVYDAEMVFVPREKLEIPDIDIEDFRFVVIKGYTKDELKAKLFELLGSGVALAEDTLADALEVAQLVGFNEADVSKVANKEAKVALYDYLGLVPSSATEFLRFVIFRATNKTLIIKNKATVASLKERNNTDIAGYLDRYEAQNGLEPLAEVFYRYKPVFLALRNSAPLKKRINRIRRLAVTNHKPMKVDLLNTVTETVGYGKKVTGLSKALADANTFRKIRLAYALKYRTTEADSILYRIRNGKSYVREFGFTNKEGAQEVLDVVLESIVEDLKANVAGKKIFLPDYVNYALPATEKQFTGDMPSGTSIRVTEDMVAGVHWENLPKYRVDLDLSIVSVDGKIGWDASYRSGGRDVLFSGDITDAPAPEGATEAFYIDRNARGTWLMNLNYFNFSSANPVPYKIVVAHDDSKKFEGRHHVINPNKVISSVSAKIDEQQKIIGIITATEEETRFYFAETGFGKAITSNNNERTTMAREYLLNMYSDAISLNDLLAKAGAEFVEDVAEADIDLTPESVERDTILKLFY